MKRLGIAICIVATFAIVGGFAGFCWIISRSLQTQTLAQLRAEIPTDLQPYKVINPAAQSRYRGLLELAKSVEPTDVDGWVWFSKDPKQRRQQALVRRKYAPAFAKLDALLGAGPLQVAPHTSSDHPPKELATLCGALADAESDAVLCQDGADARHLERLFLSLAQELRKSKGSLTDQWYAWTAEWEALTGYLGAEHASLLNNADRKELLDRLPPDDGVDPELADALKRGLTELTVPRLYATAHPGLGSRPHRGRFDVRETVRLHAQLYKEAVRDALSRSPRPWEGAYTLQQEAYKRSMSAYKGQASFQGRLMQGFTGNAYGDWLLAYCPVSQYLVRSREQATFRNMVRAIMLARHGPAPTLPDPLGYGNLQFNLRRRWVWSVGLNGIDEKGRYGPPGSYAGDFSLRY